MRKNRVKSNRLSSLELRSLGSTHSFFGSLLQDELAVPIKLHFAVPRGVMQGNSCNGCCKKKAELRAVRQLVRLSQMTNQLQEVQK